MCSSTFTKKEKFIESVPVWLPHNLADDYDDKIIKLDFARSQT